MSRRNRRLFAEQHPNDFDLRQPIDVIDIANGLLFPLSLMYAAARDDDRQKTAQFIRRADNLLYQVLDEIYPDGENDGDTESVY